MAAARTATKIDRDFLARLRHVVETERAESNPPATAVVGGSADKTAMDREFDKRRRRWEVDGSIVVGRVDITDRERYYFGRRALHDENGELLIVSIRSALGKELWSGTAESHPGRAVLKRRLTVTGWTITDWSNDFDLRRRPPRPARVATRPPAELGLKRRPFDPAEAVAALDATSAVARAALEHAVLQLDSGRAVGSELQNRIDDWNRSLRAAARQLGLDEDKASREQIDRAVEELVEKNRLNLVRRDELDRKIAALDELIDCGLLGRDELVKARQALHQLRTESPSRLF